MTDMHCALVLTFLLNMEGCTRGCCFVVYLAVVVGS